MSLATKFAVLCITFGLAGLAMADDLPTDVEPHNDGPLKVVVASCFGGGDKAELVGAAIEADGTILLAGQAEDFPTVPHVTELPLPPNPSKYGSVHREDAATSVTRAFIARLAKDGQKIMALTKFPEGTSAGTLRLGANGNIYLLVHQGFNSVILGLPGDISRLSGFLYRPYVRDFDVDANGDLLMQDMGRVIRFGANGVERCNAQINSHGSYNTGGIAVSPQTGIVAIVGCSMAQMGHRMHAEPYVYAFDRSGRPAWGLWNEDPKLEPVTDTGTSLAATMGTHIGVDADGGLLLMLKADGPNSICMHDPAAPLKPIDPAIFDGVFQPAPGFGFKNENSTALIFRANPVNGKLLKGTWMCAWPTPTEANFLEMAAATGDGKGNLLVVGDSGKGCPTKDPWYASPDNRGPFFIGDGFLAVLDRNCKMIQCGCFAGTSLTSVALRGNTAVIAGTARKNAANKEGALPAYRALAGFLGNGERNGYFVVLKN